MSTVPQPKRQKAKARRVNFLENVDDLEVLMLGELGLSTKFILEKTGLTPCQVGYRLHKATVRRGDYRNGLSAVANELVNSKWVRRVAKSGVMDKIGAIETETVTK